MYTMLKNSKTACVTYPRVLLYFSNVDASGDSWLLDIIKEKEDSSFILFLI
jgi:hypothetical protein